MSKSLHLTPITSLIITKIRNIWTYVSIEKYIKQTMSRAIKSIGVEINDSFRRYFVRNVENLKYLSKLKVKTKMHLTILCLPWQPFCRVIVYSTPANSVA